MDEKYLKLREVVGQRPGRSNRVPTAGEINRKSLEGMNREERREIAQGTLDKYLGLEEEERCAMIMHLKMCGIEKSTFT